MTYAIELHEHGGPEKLVGRDIALPPPGPSEARIRHTAIGVNYVDINHRRGTYAAPLPTILGREAAGIVEAIGPGVIDVRPGQRVGYCLPPTGAYCEARNYPANLLVPLPEAISERQSAAMLLKGLTAGMLLLHAYPLKRGETVLIHAAAGGVGSIACQWAKHLGATVIGTVSSDEKAAFARMHGCDHVIVQTRENLVERVREITGGRMLPVVYDSIGQDTLLASLACLHTRGRLVWFGVASGPVKEFDPSLLAKGSLSLTWAAMVDYVRTRAELLSLSDALFAAVASGAIRIEIGKEYALREAAQAHRDIEARRLTGSLVLTP